MFLRDALTGIAVFLISGCDGGKGISEVSSFFAATAYSDTAIGSSCVEIQWATDSVLIVTARNKLVQAIDPSSGKELWSKKFDQCIEAITCNSDHVYIALDPSYPYEAIESIRRLEVATGVDSTPKGIPQPFLVQALIWSPELQALCILAHEALWIYSADLVSVARRVPYSGSLPMVTSDGKSVLLAEITGSCSLIDLKVGSITHIHGPPHKPGDKMTMMDAPFLSNAFCSSSGPLIRIIDNSWATGRIYFHNTPKDAGVEKDSKNGHAVAAVHWPTQRLAVSGTEKNLLMFSATGTSLGEIPGATTERTYALSFSPSGSMIATLSSDGRIKVFDIPRTSITLQK